MVARPDWGAKHICHDCGTKYYDFNRSPIICPKCGAGFKADTLLRSRRNRPAAAKAPAPKVVIKDDAAVDKKDDKTAALAVDDNDLPEVKDTAANAAGPIEDVSELGEDDDDMAEVVTESDEKEDT